MVVHSVDPYYGELLKILVPLQLFVQPSVVGIPLSSHFFPYSVVSPKRLVFQHMFQTIGNKFLHSLYDGITDANTLLFLLKKAPMLFYFKEKKLGGITKILAFSNFGEEIMVITSGFIDG